MRVNLVETRGQPVSRDDQNSPVLNFLFSAFISVVAIIWLIKGRVILPNKAVFLYGTHARIVAAMALLLGLAPVLSRLRKKNRKNEKDDDL